ncbi:MAG: NADH-quinone oxidoreductase subunit NuoG [Hyphomicrobiaceae bacterium]
MSKTLLVDGEEIEVEDGITLLQACEIAGREIPRFCYHERLSIAGNCRMCLVQVDGMPKPVASCAMGVNDLRPTRDGSPNRIDTLSPLVKKAREGVMEFLLINHPLDCPICDQGGECDLQDQAMAYGIGGTRYAMNKRAVDEKYLGPLIKTAMTRCIQCTRCVRFMTEVAGVEELGAIGRGEDMEITTYLEHGMTSELSANVVDLCPVGALTHRPWAHNARPWELRKTETIDVMDAVGSAIRVDCRGREVMRILPRLNDSVNEEWISDKSRHVADGLRTQRLDKAMIRRDGRLVPVTWSEALSLVAEKLRSVPPEQIGSLAGDLAGVEEMFALKDLMGKLDVGNIDCRQYGEALDPARGRATYIFNPGISAIDNADAIMLVGTNPRLEAAVLNGRIRKRYRNGDVLIGVIGEQFDLGYPYEYLGDGPAALERFVDHAAVAKNRPLMIIGPGAYMRPDGAAIMALAARAALSLGVVREGWNGFAVLNSAAARVGGLDVGFVPRNRGFMASQIADGQVDVIYNLGADEIEIAPGPFVIYQGSHGDRGASRADVILPGAAYTEKSATFVNLEGRPQITARAAFPPGDAREDWKILRALSEQVGHVLSYDTVEQLRSEMYLAAPQLAGQESVLEPDIDAIRSMSDADNGSRERINKRAPFAGQIDDFYLTNPIARSSAVMAELSALKHAAIARTAAE